MSNPHSFLFGGSMSDKNELVLKLTATEKVLKGREMTFNSISQAKEVIQAMTASEFTRIVNRVCKNNNYKK